MSDLVIGEGVALDLRLAKLPSRALAKVLDLLVQLTASSVLMLVLGVILSSVDGAVAAGVFILFGVAVIVGYPAFMETVTRGRTFGKMALGLRVVRTDGGPIKFRHALVRSLSGIGDFVMTAGVLAVVTSFCSKQGRRTGDLLAGTVVLRDRAPDAGVNALGMAALAMPYPLLAWAQAQDLSMLPDDLALAARQYLTRMHELRPEIAARMGLELAEDVARFVPPPAGAPPWAFLAAVTAERRARQMQRAEAERRTAWEQAQRARFLPPQAPGGWDRDRMPPGAWGQAPVAGMTGQPGAGMTGQQAAGTHPQGSSTEPDDGGFQPPV